MEKEYAVVDGRAALTVFETYIKTTPQRLWEAITDPGMRASYSFGVRTESDWKAGSSYESAVPGVIEIASGENLEVDPPRRLVQSFNALWSDEVRGAGTSRVSWEIEPVGTSCRLRVTHDQLPSDANPELFGGWPMILSGLKTLLESGDTLDTPGSLRWGGAAQG
ncbi:MAG: SRPBCC family protein [Solirubrobacterales bacterium]